MKNVLSKLMVSVSLAAAIALAMPMGFMTASVIRRESPRQIAAQEEMEDAADGAENREDGQDAPDRQLPEAEPEDKPEVAPDPGAASVQEEVVSGEVVPVPDPEPAPAPAKKASSTKKTTQTQKKAEAVTTKAAQEPKSQTEQANSPWPKAVLGPGEAPCMVDGLDGYSYDYGLDNRSTAAQQTSNQEAPSMAAGIDGGNGSSTSSGESSSNSSSTGGGTGTNVPDSTIVYVSDYSSKIHSISYCSNMKNYQEMTKGEADANGYEYCKDCW